jgi:hypothetical protein
MEILVSACGFPMSITGVHLRVTAREASASGVTYRTYHNGTFADTREESFGNHI